MKKFLALFLTLALFASVLPALADVSPLLPYDGEEVVFQGFWDEYKQNIDDAINTITPLDEALKEKVGNVRIAWEPIFSDARQKLDLMMATDDLPDIIVTVSMYSRLKKYDMGYYLDLRDYAEYAPNLMAAYEHFPTYDYLKGANGEIWWIPQQVISDASGENWFVNTEAFEALGVEMPTTWEEVKDAMRLWKEQNPDKYPLLRPYWHWGLGDEISMIGFTQDYKGYGIYYDTDDGQWKFGLTEESSHAKEAVQELINMYEEGFFPPDALTRTRDQGYDTARNGDWLFMYAYTQSPYTEMFNESAEEIPFAIDPIALPIPVPVTYHRGMYNYDGGVINADVKNPELLVSLVDYWQSEEVQMMDAFGIEGVSYEFDEKGNPVFLPGYQTVEEQNAFGIKLLDEPYYIFSFQRWAPLQMPAKPVDQMRPSERASVTVTSWLHDGTLTLADHGLAAASLSDEDNEIVSAIMTPVNTFIDENLYMFVEGTRPMSEWDAFVEEALSYGDVAQALEIYNNSPVLLYSDEYEWMPVYSID